MKKLYTYLINLKDYSIEEKCVDIDDQYYIEQEGVCYHKYDDMEYIYAESWVSINNARQLILDFCEKFLHAGAAIIREVK